MSEDKAEHKSELNKSKKPVASRILLVLLALLIAYCCIFSLVAKIVRSESLPMPLGFGMAVVLTGSMEPKLHANDLVIIRKASDYRVGDIAVYQTGGTPVIHRIVDYDSNSGIVVTKGDANNAEDEPISTSRLKGKLAFSIPFIGIVFRFLQTVPGIIMVIVLLFTLFYLSVRAKEQDTEEAEKKSSLKEEIDKLRQQLGDNADDEVDLRSETEKEIERLQKQLGIETDPKVDAEPKSK